MSVLRPWGMFLVYLSMRAGDGTLYTAARCVKAQDPDGAAVLAAEVEERLVSGSSHLVLGVKRVRLLPGRSA